MDPIKTGNFIAQLRREKGLTQEALGNRLGVTNKTISRWENGNYMPDIEMFQVLSEQFGVSINELLSGRRLNENAFRAEADRNIIDNSKAGAFSKKRTGCILEKKVAERPYLPCAILACPVYGILRLCLCKKISYLYRPDTLCRYRNIWRVKE